MTRYLLMAILTCASGVARAQDVLEVPTYGGSGLPADLYVVQPGDTLWDISTTFLGSSEYWPRLWSINDYITNPHWIYPGNHIVFVPGTLIEPPQVVLETTTPASAGGYVTPAVPFVERETPCGPDIHFDRSRSAVIYQAAGLLEDSQEVEVLGEVRAAHSGARFLSEGHLLYVGVDEERGLACGDVVSVLHRERRKVRKPGGKAYGALWRIAAEARVLHVEDGIATVQVRRSWSEVERGDQVSKVIPVTVQTEVSAPRGTLEGTIVARLQGEEAQLGFTGETVFVDRGRADGVRVGNAFWIVEQRDEFLDMYHEDEDLPRSVVGRLVVVRVDETSATGVVTDANRHVEEGARVVMRLD
ncbi:MAG: LysM peptidoglycan-binding domain-containing protein [Deltaproteobacteria bacterium]|nr:LysM peptidoglycan-binding domain-containing protein [Deltaproteobacteria bacterium]